MAVLFTSLVIAVGGLAGTARAGAEDETRLRQSCSWLERAIAREPARDDAIMMFMRGMRPKCTALLEGLGRKDGSVTNATIVQINKDLKDLRDVVDPEWRAAHPNEPDPAAGPGPEEKAAADKAEADKQAAERAAVERAAAEKAQGEKAAADKAEAERLAAEKAAAEKAQREQAERDAKTAAMSEKERRQAEKAAQEEARRLEKERVAAEKKAAEDARKAETERVAAEKAAAEEAERARLAEARAEKERLAAEQKAAGEAERERMLAEKAEREQLARDLAAAEKLRAGQLGGSGGSASASAPPADKRLTGTWEQPSTKVLDRNVKRTLNLISTGKKVEGELYEEVWFPAPVSWIDKSCGGNTTFRMVTTARVTGELNGRNLELRRDVPRLLACTCSSRCTVEDRRRGMDLEVSATWQQITDEAGVFSKPGAATVAGREAGAEPARSGPVAIDGNWETSPFKAQDRSVILRLELTVKDGRLTGTLIERSSQALPLQNWSDRFCDGADKWEWVTQWSVDGKVPKGHKAELTAKDGAHILCTCPSKCKAADKKRVIQLEIGPDGRSLTEDDHVFERR